MADGEKPIFGEFECTTSQPCNTQKSVPLHPCITINKIAPSGANPNPVVADARAVVKQQETEPELTPGNLISDVCPSSTNDEKLKAEREKKYKLLWVDPVSKIKRNVILVGKGDNDDERIVKGIKSHHIFSAKRADCCAYKNGLTEAPLQVGDIVSLSDRKGRFRLSEMIGSAVHIVSELTKQVFKCPINLINKAWNCNSELLWEAV